jgi:hypothetical protein
VQLRKDEKMNELPIEIRWNIASQDLQMWRNTRYQSELRLRVNRRIGSDPNVIKQLEDELIRIESAIDAYQEELKALEAERGKRESAS